MPYTLQVGRQISRTGRGDEQITSKLIVELFQIEILCPFTIIRKPLVDRYVVIIIHIVQYQAYTTEQIAVIPVMLIQQQLIALFFCLTHPI